MLTQIDDLLQSLWSCRSRWVWQVEQSCNRRASVRDLERWKGKQKFTAPLGQTSGVQTMAESTISAGK